MTLGQFVRCMIMYPHCVIMNRIKWFKFEPINECNFGLYLSVTRSHKITPQNLQRITWKTFWLSTWVSTRVATILHKASLLLPAATVAQLGTHLKIVFMHCCLTVLSDLPKLCWSTTPGAPRAHPLILRSKPLKQPSTSGVNASLIPDDLLRLKLGLSCAACPRVVMV